MVFKIKLEELWEEGLGCFVNQWHVNTWPPRNVPLGKVSLSIKVKKGRRRLIKGRIEPIPDSVRDDECGSRLVYYHVFTPNNPARMRQVLNIAKGTK